MTDNDKTQYKLVKMCERRGAFTKVYIDGRWVADFNVHQLADDYISQRRTIEEKDREIAKHENDAKYRQGVMAAQAASIEQLQVRVKELDREIDILRLYGNKDCTAMADEAIKKIREPKP